ncbi:MAG TPA: glycosyltransferase family 4 protein [Vicinamibacteria bacterium]|nr:glycosyltransferase family 4 protein [Vicinamibacteria bacterium]
MTRVLFLAESFHPVLGGGETHIRRLATALARRGMPATVMARRSEAAWPAEEELDGVRVLRVGPAGPARRGKYAMVPRVVRALGRHRSAFDVLVVRGTRVLGLPGLITGRWLRKPVVLQCEVGGELSGRVYTWGTRWDGPAPRIVLAAAVSARNRLFRDADAFVTISEETRREFLDAGLDPDRVHHVPHGVDSERFRPSAAGERVALREGLRLPAAARLVTYTGRLLRGKGLEVLVDAFADIAPRRPDARLVLVGSGRGQALDAEEELRERAASRALGDRVVFPGRVENVPEWLGASDVFAFPSFFEAMPLAVLEAAACGLPCVATRVGGVPDVIEDGVSGWLVTPGDRAGLANALLEALVRPELAATRGAAARAAVLARFDFAGSVDRYRALFDELGSRRA